MPKLEYFVVCESMSVDRDTNRVSLFNIIEDIRPLPPDTPGHILVQMAAVSSWNRLPGDEDKDFQVLLRIHDPGGEQKEFPLNLKMDRPRHRLTFRIQGVPASRDGELRFELLLNGKHAGEHSVTVHPA